MIHGFSDAFWSFYVTSKSFVFLSTACLCSQNKYRLISDTCEVMHWLSRPKAITWHHPDICIYIENKHTITWHDLICYRYFIHHACRLCKQVHCAKRAWYNRTYCTVKSCGNAVICFQNSCRKQPVGIPSWVSYWSLWQMSSLPLETKYVLLIMNAVRFYVALL